MQLWPTKCDDVVALITLNQESDIPLEIWKTALKKVERINGAFQMINTSYADLSFLPPELMLFSNDIDISFINNSKLTNANALLNMIPQSIKYLQMLNNPNLDATAFCDSYEFGPGWEVSGNKVDCNCRAEKIDSRNLGKFEECEIITGKLVLTDLTISDQDDLPSLSKLKQIGGTLEIKNTNLQNLSFFENLEKLEYTSNLSEHKTILNIHDNPEMTRLGLPSLKYLGYYYFEHYKFNFQNLHPKFCLTVQEMSLFIDYYVDFKNLEATYCPDYSWSIEQPKLCVFDKMSNLDTECKYVFGNIVMEKGDEEFGRKLKNVTRIFGSLTLRNTSLENCNFLRSLQKIVNLNESISPLQFLSNKHLQNLQFPDLRPIINGGKKQAIVIVKDNHPYFFKMTRFCNKLQYQTKAKVLLDDGNDCKSINRTLPPGEGHDFDEYDGTGDYTSDYSSFSPWYEEYDGVFWELSKHDFSKIYRRLEQVNNVAIIIGLLINLFHLIVLLQKELRGSFVYIMMIGICLCDITIVSTFIAKFLGNLKWIKKMKTNKDHCTPWTYSSTLFELLEDRILASSRRCSSLLALLMALFRTLSVISPLDVKIMKLTKPKIIGFLVLGVLLICASYDLIPLLRCEIRVSEYVEMCSDGEYNYLSECPEDDLFDDDAIPINRIISVIDGSLTVIIGILYLIVTTVLFYQLKVAQKRRKALNGKDNKESTLLLVTVMAVTFFLSEVIFGVAYLTKTLINQDLWAITNILDGIEIVTWTFLIVNSSVHCFICLLMSGQYRGVVKGMFCGCKRSVKVEAIVFVSKS